MPAATPTDRTTPECADGNARLIEDVFAEIAKAEVPGYCYEVVRRVR